MEPEKLGPGSRIVGGLDHRLACLQIAILEEWDELQAAEVDGALVIRIKEAAKLDNPAEAPEYRHIEKQRKPVASPERGLAGIN